MTREQLARLDQELPPDGPARELLEEVKRLRGKRVSAATRRQVALAKAPELFNDLRHTKASANDVCKRLRRGLSPDYDRRDSLIQQAEDFLHSISTAEARLIEEYQYA